jgi:capsular exopolysaccharide synthesis family protein
MKEQQSPYLIMEEENTIDIKQAITEYLRYWPWFILSLMLCATASFLYLRYTAKIYETTAKIKILNEGKGLNLPMDELLFNSSNVNLENEIEILSSYRILKKVEKELQLSHVFYEEGSIQTSQLDTLPFSYRRIIGVDSVSTTGSFNISVTPSAFEIYDFKTDSTTLFANHDTNITQHSLPFQIKIENPEELALCIGKQYNVHIKTIKNAVLNLKSSLEVNSVGKKSDIVELRMEGESASRSEKILNAILNAFNEDGIQDRQLISKRTLEFIDDRFIFLSEELDSIESDKKDFKQENNLVYIEADTQLSLKKGAQADDEVFRIENQLALSQLLEDAINDPNTKSKLLPANFGLESSAINTLIETYNTALLDNEKLIGSGGVNNPIVRQLQLQLLDLRANIDSSLKVYRNQLQLSQRQLASRDKKFKSEVYNLPQKEKLLRAINRQQKIKESLFLLLLQKREEASISLAVTEPSVKVVEYALSGSLPVSPKPKIIYLGALLLGLIIPFGILYVMFLLDNKIHGKEDIEKSISDIPVVGEIPTIKEGTNTIFSNPNDRSILAESFRILSSNTNYILSFKEEGKGSVVYCTSSIKGEGKTFVSLNLSLALSSLNKKVLLIGADLRNPQVHSYLEIDKHLPGLSNYLHDPNFEWKGALIKGFSEHPGHDTLISGVIPPNPPNLLTNGRFEVLLEEARTRYDYIIVDTAPTISVTDTLLISKFADATIYITRANYTEKILLEHANSLAKNKKLKNMGYVINRVGINKRSRYGYNYGYGYGYSEDTFKRSWKDKIFNK